MTRNLKALGLAFVAVFAMSAIAASAAHATEYFHQHEEKTIITASNEGTGMTAPETFELVTGTEPVKCTTSKFEGTDTELLKKETAKKGTTWTKESLTVTPTYSGCTLAGKPATVDTTTAECHYKLFAATTETVAGKAHGNVEIICKDNTKGITITVPELGVTVHVFNQLIPHAINYANVNTSGGTNGEEVTISTTAEMNIKWTCTPKAICNTAYGTQEGTEATYKGLATAKGFKDLNAGAPKEKTGENKYEEGEQRGIWKGPEE